MDTGAGFVLVVPPIVIGAGWFVLVRHFADVFAIAPIMVVAVNAVMAMCHRMLEEHVSNEVALLAFDRCDRVAERIAALASVAACQKQEYFIDYADMSTDLVAKASSATGICPQN